MSKSNSKHSSLFTKKY